MRTQQEIDRQIEGLLAERNSLPEHNFFGQNNYARFDYMIRILRGEEYVPLPEDHDDYDDDMDLSGFEASEWLRGAITDDLFSEVEGS